MDDRTVSVLIADGRAHTRSAMRLLLVQEPQVVVVGEAADVDEALSTVATLRPDAVLLEWELPRQPRAQEGSLVVKRLRAASPGSLVIALSGLPEARHEALAAGADGFVSKGDPPERLLSAVRACRRDG